VIDVGTPMTAVVGVAVNDASEGPTGVPATMTTVCIATPARLEHVSVNVVVLAIVTVTGTPLDTRPTPLSIVQIGIGVGVAVYVHVNVTSVGVFDGIGDGVAVNVASVGATSGASICDASAIPASGAFGSDPQPTAITINRASLCARIEPPRRLLPLCTIALPATWHFPH
jgi:hypothetical protein